MPKNDDNDKTKKTGTKKGGDASSKAKKSKKSSAGLSAIIAAEHKKAKKIKVSRKALKKDELQESSAKVIDYLTSHSNQTFITFGTIIAVVLIAVFINFYRTSKVEKASELFTRARNLYDLGMNETPPSSVTLKGSLELFTGVINSYQGGSEEALSYFYSGNIHFNLKEYDDSIEMYNKFLASSLDNETYDQIAKNNIAYCYLSKKEFDKAIDLFKDVADSSSGYIKESALYDLGLVYENAGKKDEAIALYESFITDHPDSSFYEKVQERINSIQAK